MQLNLGNIIRELRRRDGRTQARYLGEALLSLADEFSEQLVYALVNDRKNYDTDMPVTKIKGVIDLFYLICEDGNLGKYHKNVANLYLYMSRLQWEFGDRDGAFASLDSALQHARSFDKFQKCDTPHYTAMLIKHAECKHGKNCDGDSLTEKLSEDWPVWCNPDYSEVEREIKADPRWEEWVKRTKE